MPARPSRRMLTKSLRPAKSNTMLRPPTNDSTGVEISNRKPVSKTITEKDIHHRELETLQGGVLHDRQLNELYLRQRDWNVEDAYDRWRQDRDKIIANGANHGYTTSTIRIISSGAGQDQWRRDPASDTEDEKSDGDELQVAWASQQYVPKTNIEEERRVAARILFTVIQGECSKNEPILLCISEAILILHSAEWEWSKAKELAIDISSTRKLLSSQFDHMRKNADAVDQDERLATMLQITHRPDWYSVQFFLALHKWDLIEAIVAWYEKGIEPVRHPKDKAGTQKEGHGRRNDPTGKPLPLPGVADTVPSNYQSDVFWAPEPQEYVPGGRDRVVERPQSSNRKHNAKPGFLLDRDFAPVQKGAMKPSKLVVECIQKGVYHQNIFRHAKYNWTGTDLDSRPAFNWKAQPDVEALNSWRRQNRQRRTLTNRRKPSQTFSQEEHDFLYEWMRQRLVQRMKQNPGMTKEELLPLTISMREKENLAKAFNKKFAGRVFSGHKEPLRQRNINALMTQCHRYAKLQEDFELAPDKYTDTRREGRIKRKRSTDDEEGSDDEGEGEDEDEDEEDGSENDGEEVDNCIMSEA